MAEVTVIDESNQPYGTYKDRRSKLIVEKAVRDGVNKLCLITSGNAGYSLAQFAKPYGIKIVCAVDKGLRQSIKDQLSEVCHRVFDIDLTEKIWHPEDIVAMSRENEQEVIEEVTNGCSEAYEDIVDQVDSEPNYLIVPVGSGEAFCGIFDALSRRKWKTVLVGVGVESPNSFADKLGCFYTPYQTKMDQIVQKGHRLIRLTEPEVISAYEGNKDKYQSEPSATVVWAGLGKLDIPADAKVVVVNSGKGVF